MLLGKAAPGGAADLHGLEFFAVLDAAADVENDLPEGGAHGNLHQARVHYIAGEGEGLGAGAGVGADGAVPGGPFIEDAGDIGKGLYIVENGGLAPQAVVHGAGRLGAGHTALALDGGGKGTALAADEGTGTPVDVHMEAEAGVHDIIAQQAQTGGLVNGYLQALHGQGILGPDIDIALGGPGGDTGNHHALDNGVGVTLHDGAVHKGAGVTLIAVADDVLHIGDISAHTLPLAPGREAAAAPAPEAGVGNLPADGLVRHVEQGFFKGAVAVLGDVLLQILGIAGTAALEHHPVLLFIKGDILLTGVGYAVLVVGQAVDNFAAQKGALYDLVAVLGLYPDIHDAQGLDVDQAAHFAEAMAAAHFNVEALFLLAVVGKAHIDAEAPLLALVAEIFIDLHGAAGDAAGTGADKHRQGGLAAR